MSRASGIIAGDCTSAPPFTYGSLARVVFANSTTVVLDRTLYNGGSGCCLGRGCGGSCQILQSFEVVTELGNVPAGTFRYRVFYQNCQPCSTAAAAGNGTCPPAVRATAAGAR